MKKLVLVMLMMGSLATAMAPSVRACAQPRSTYCQILAFFEWLLEWTEP